MNSFATQSVSRQSQAGDLSDLVEAYALPDDLPSPAWLTRLHLQRPRTGTRCLGGRTRLAKRLTDITGAACLLVVLAPVMLLVAAAVKLTSSGPVIFRQTRVGLNLRRNAAGRRKCAAGGAPPAEGERRRQPDRRAQSAFGRPFVLYKFRTMRVDAEQDGARLAQRNDPRVTPVGRLLRRTRLDELPQLWNVLRGEMSLVGPRPERPEFIDQLSEQIPDYLNRLGLKPGLTGLAQILNGYDEDLRSFRRKVALDLLYLQNCCFLNDLKILVRTVRVVLTGRGAR